jgi:translation initiation factor IF-2
LSAVSGEGVDDLLERILLQSEMLELAYNPKRNAVGVVLEVTKDPKQGVQTTILLMTGTMKVGDIIMVHNTYGKVRRMVDRSGKEIKVAHGGDPVMILGMQDIPEPGRVAEVTDTERQAQERIAAVIEQEKSQKESG